ncbi:hypothetical protein [Helicoverpa armigera NPV NNg1]|uniref:Early 23 kDa protein n=1 Tax=Helicoverpa armigera NPV NNg1 TaxID=566972 RepID=B5X008_9ABAC|nr:hypothetical protein [Helicoverpa armigera NPV NNg1]
MNINLYQPLSHIDNLIVFTIVDARFSVTVYMFNAKDNVIDQNEGPNTVITKLVSGHESGRNVSMNMSTTKSWNENIIRDDVFIITMFRLPFVARSLIEDEKCFSRPVLLLAVDYNNSTEIWHVLSVRRRSNMAKCYERVDALFTTDSAGNEIYSKKEHVILKGNVPAAFIASLNKAATTSCDMINITHPHVIINSSRVTIITH